MKEKKVKKSETTKRKTKKTKKNKNVEILEENKKDIVVCNSDTRFVVKVVAVLCTFFSTIFAFIFLIFGIVSVLSAIKLPKEQLIKSNIVTSFLSKINGYSVAEVENSINVIDNKVFFIFFEIILPTAALIFAMILLINFSRKLMIFFNDIRREKDFFKTIKFAQLRDLVVILSISLLILIVMLSPNYVILFFIIEALLIIILCLYKRCVKNEEEK